MINISAVDSCWTACQQAYHERKAKLCGRVFVFLGCRPQDAVRMRSPSKLACRILACTCVRHRTHIRACWACASKGGARCTKKNSVQQICILCVCVCLRQDRVQVMSAISLAKATSRCSECSYLDFERICRPGQAQVLQKIQRLCFGGPTGLDL